MIRSGPYGHSPKLGDLKSDTCESGSGTMKVSSGTVHPLPADLRKALIASPQALAAWEDITPLARNEWICWTISVSKRETREDHVRRVCSQLVEGMRRPCCCIGCIHRTDKAISPSVRGILSMRSSQKVRAS